MNRKGFAPVLIIGIIALVVIAAAVGWYFVVRQNATVPAGVACTTEAKQCPDGSYVGRTGPDCQFAACPGVAPQASSTTQAAATSSTINTSNWQTYEDAQNLFSIQIPSTWNVNIQETAADDPTVIKNVVFEFPDGTPIFTIFVFSTSSWANSQAAQLAFPDQGGPTYTFLAKGLKYAFAQQYDFEAEISYGQISFNEISQTLPQIFTTFKVASSS